MIIHSQESKNITCSQKRNILEADMSVCSTSPTSHDLTFRAHCCKPTKCRFLPKKDDSTKQHCAPKVRSRYDICLIAMHQVELRLIDSSMLNFQLQLCNFFVCEGYTLKLYNYTILVTYILFCKVIFLQPLSMNYGFSEKKIHICN